MNVLKACTGLLLMLCINSGSGQIKGPRMTLADHCGQIVTVNNSIHLFNEPEGGSSDNSTQTCRVTFKAKNPDERLLIHWVIPFQVGLKKRYGPSSFAFGLSTWMVRRLDENGLDVIDNSTGNSLTEGRWFGLKMLVKEYVSVFERELSVQEVYPEDRGTSLPKAEQGLRDWTSTGQALIFDYVGINTIDQIQAVLTAFKDPSMCAKNDTSKFICNGTAVCISSDLVCNGENNCGGEDNKSDELKCKAPASSAGFHVQYLPLVAWACLFALIVQYYIQAPTGDDFVNK
ncbi:uncharacterized protein LOC106175278 [Lingula anatina]|uniref:Uncharacterized protein LOC106175278 n=1 Tax=Lingula anatina TaxID=7574 RepID=A0A1S3JQL0_LINAN|nr:uncharacterized protein LOC106175278 [Lingula anatina]|eukprot:XP_013412645.1 uncharacterized protein LOC106175278 [Lingula anatina]